MREKEKQKPLKLRGKECVPFWHRTSTILILYNIAIITCIAFLLFFISFRVSSNTLEQQAYNRLLSNNLNKLDHFIEWIRNNEESISLFADRPLVRQETAALITCLENKGDCLEISATLTNDHLMAKINTDADFEDAAIIQISNGMVIVSTDSALLGNYREHETYFVKGKNDTYTESSSYYHDEGKVVMHSATPILSPSGNAIAVLAVHLNIEEMQEIFQIQNELSESEDTYLVNRSNFYLTEPRFGENYILTHSVYTDGVVDCLEGKTGTAIYDDYRGVSVVGAYEWISEFDMCIVSEMDYTEAFGAINDLRMQLIQLGLLLIVSLSAIIIFFSKQMMRPLKLLNDHAKEISKGNLKTRLILKSPNEHAALATTFNEMAENLEATQQENKKLIHDLKKLNDDLENNIEERTHALIKAQKELEDKAKDLERSNDELQRFAYIASHDLQEPLRMVGSFLQLLKKRYEDKLDDNAREYIAFAVNGAEHMKELTENLLTYSRVGTQGHAFDDVNLNEIIGDIKLDLYKLIKESHANINYEKLPIVFGDSHQLKQTLQNLIGNAIKYRGDKDPEINITFEEDEEFWTIHIRDNGIGIPNEYFTKVFAIFQRLHTRDEYPGTGIGLAISKRIIERHGGRIWVESEPGKGSIFSFTLLKGKGVINSV